MGREGGIRSGNEQRVTARERQMFVASTELLNIVSLHACREHVSSESTDFSAIASRSVANFVDCAYIFVKLCINHA